MRFKTIVIIVFDGVQLLDVAGPMDVFAKLEQVYPGSYSTTIASLHGGDVVTNSGVVLGGTVSIADLSLPCDTILIAGGDEADLRKAIYGEGLGQWVSAQASTTRRIGSVCTGAFVLAAAGLLDGRKATTHWHSSTLLQQLCPQARVEHDVIFTVDPPIYTSAGVTAGIDLALALVEEDYGRAKAMEVARELVVFMRRPGGQAQLSASLEAQSQASNRMADLLTWIFDNPTEDLSVTALAARMGMSERNFSRSFRRQAGDTPARYVERTRADLARSFLETSDWPLERIAERSGFGSVDSLQRAFKHRFCMTPVEWRHEK